MVPVVMLGEAIRRGGMPEGALDRAGMYEVARLFFGALVRERPKDLLEVDQVEVAGGKKAQRARYEVRHRTIRRPEHGVIHISPPMTAEPFVDVLRYLYDGRLEDLEAEQPGAQWALVGVLIRQHNLAKVSVRPGGGPGKKASADAMASVFSNQWDDRNLGAMTKKFGPPTSVVDEKAVEMVVDLVFADMSQSEDLADMLAKHGDYKPGSSPMERYSQGRLLHQLPAALRAERQEVARVVGEIEALEKAAMPSPAPEREVAPVVDPLARLSPEQLREFLKDTPSPRLAMLLGVTEEALLATAGTTDTTTTTEPPASRRPRKDA
jgi:hypothetical protein